MTCKTTFHTATLLAAVGLSALTPLSLALAKEKPNPQLTKPNKDDNRIFVPSDHHVATVIANRSKSNVKDNIILVPSDANSEVRLTGLEPGDYEVALAICCSKSKSNVKNNIILSVGGDGRLAFVTTKETLRPLPNERRVSERLRHKVSAIPFDGGTGKIPENAVIFDVRQVFSVSPPIPCAPTPPGTPNTCGRIRNHIDVNASNAAEIVRLAPETSLAAAETLIAERTKNGYFESAHDFASRVCTKTNIDFGDAPVRMGNASIFVNRGGDPKQAGFKCASGKDGGEPDVSLFGIGPMILPLWAWIN